MQMKNLSLVLLAVLTVPALADTKPAPSNPAAITATKEIEKAFGFVPAFIRQMPQLMVASWWEQTKAISFGPTALDGKTKELIGLAVAASIPCEFCVLFHTEAARLNGATDQELQEAVAVSSMTRGGSVVLHGVQVDKVQFKKDVERIVKTARAGKK
jgi:AhpD family alkylhydroperoxidase